VVEQVLKAYPNQIRFVYKHFPLPNHEHAMNAAKASMAAHRQGKFWEMHDVLFNKSPELQEDRIMQYAQNLNLDMEQFKKDYASPEVEKEVEGDIQLGSAVEIRGTPTFFVNGKRLPSWALESFQVAIKEALEKNK
jgi:protein-disulfide isomerase